MTTAQSTTRFLFPEDRMTFVYGPPGSPILNPPRTGFQIFTNPACTALADIEDTQGNPIAYATVYTDEVGQLPEFYGPAGLVRRVYAKVVGTQQAGHALLAQFSDQLQNVPLITSGSHAPGPSDGVIGGFFIDLGLSDDPGVPDAPKIYGPKTAQGWPPPVNMVGPIGPSGAAYTWHQNTPQTPWTMDHPLPYHPAVTLIDSNNEVFHVDLEYPYLGRVIARLGAPENGRAEMT